MALSPPSSKNERFSHQVVRLGNKIHPGGSVGIKVNDEVSHYFQTLKGLRQGDPLSPMLFNIIADMLAIIINRAKEDGQVGGLIPHLVEGGI
jgi:hypothetical protein